MKRILLTLLAAATAAQAVITEADRVAVLTPDRAHITFPKGTVNTDYVITALFQPKWLPKLKAQTSTSLLGIQRDTSASDTYAAVGLYNNRVVFTLCDPGTGIFTGGAAAPTSENMPTADMLGSDPLYANAKAVAITMFYTEDPNREDLVLISAWQQDGTFVDAYSPQLLTLFDDSPAIGAGMHATILYNGMVFGGENWGLPDVIQVTHDVLTGTLVPEPATAAMGLLAAAGLAARRKRKALCK